MLGDRRLPFAVEFDQPCIKPQLRCTEANKFLEEFEWLLLRKAIEEPDEGYLVRQSQAGYEGAILGEAQSPKIQSIKGDKRNGHVAFGTFCVIRSYCSPHETAGIERKCYYPDKKRGIQIHPWWLMC